MTVDDSDQVWASLVDIDRLSYVTIVKLANFTRFEIDLYKRRSRNIVKGANAPFVPINRMMILAIQE